MQQFPNFYPNQTNSYNPYMQRMENLQQFQQALQTQMPVVNQFQNQMPTLGKVVESVDIVRVTDIPMDGNVYYFPKADGSEIYSKQFLQNGQTRILTFKPIIEDNPDKLSIEDEKLSTEQIRGFLGAISAKVDDMYNRLEEFMNAKNAPKSKKEAVKDE